MPGVCSDAVPALPGARVRAGTGQQGSLQDLQEEIDRVWSAGLTGTSVAPETFAS